MSEVFYSMYGEHYWPQGDVGHRVEQPPGGINIPLTTVYLITQDNCVNCPAAKAVVEEALLNSEITVETIDLLKMDPDFEFRLLENQVFIASTPSILVETKGNLKMLYSGAVPSVDDVREQLGVN